MDRRHTQQSVESEHAPLVSQELSNTGGQNERWEDFMQKRNHTASSEKLSNLCNACMRLLITTDRKPWKYSWIAIVTVLFLSTVVLMPFGGYKSINLSYKKAIYGGLPAKNGFIMDHSFQQQGVLSRSACLLMNFVDCEGLTAGAIANSSCARNATGDLIHPNKCDPGLQDAWIANDDSVMVDMFKHECWYSGGTSAAPFLDATSQLAKIVCSRMHVPTTRDSGTIRPISLPNQRSTQVVITILGSVTLSLVWALSISFLLVHTEKSVRRLFYPTLIGVLFLFVFTMMNLNLLLNLWDLRGLFIECEGLSPMSYAGEVADCKYPNTLNSLGSAGTPTCVKKDNQGASNIEAKLQIAPSLVCKTDIEGNYKDVLIEEFVNSVNCYLAGIILSFFLGLMISVALLLKGLNHKIVNYSRPREIEMGYMSFGVSTPILRHSATDPQR